MAHKWYPDYMNETTEKAIALLESAAGRLDALGWTQFHNGDQDGPNCMSGALRWQAMESDTNALVLTRALKALSEIVGTVPGYNFNIAGWNDTICPDEFAASDKLREAAKYLAERERV